MFLSAGISPTSGRVLPCYTSRYPSIKELLKYPSLLPPKGGTNVQQVDWQPQTRPGNVGKALRQLPGGVDVANGAGDRFESTPKVTCRFHRNGFHRPEVESQAACERQINIAALAKNECSTFSRDINQHNRQAAKCPGCALVRTGPFATTASSRQGQCQRGLVERIIRKTKQKCANLGHPSERAPRATHAAPYFPLRLFSAATTQLQTL